VILTIVEFFSVVVMSFVIGMKMAYGRERRIIARLQRKNMELEDRLREAESYVKVIDTTVQELLVRKPPSEYVIEEVA
jgi:uncharacterized protein YacL